MAQRADSAVSLHRARDSRDADKCLRILMLHGFGQSGDEFRIKTTRLRAYLSTRLPPALLSRYAGGITFSYPTGPLELPLLDTTDTAPGSDEESKYAWWRTLEVISEYKEFPSTLAYLTDYISREGPFDGVVGFSQGAALAAILVSWCEAPQVSDRASAIAIQGVPVTAKPPQRPLKFAVCYSGYRATLRYYAGFYNPRIQTPVFSMVGNWDHMVNTTRSQELKESCSSIEIMSHPGTHYVPTGDKYLRPMGDFISRALMSQSETYLNGVDTALHSPGLFNDGTLPPKPASVDGSMPRPRVRCISRRSYRVYLGRSMAGHFQVAHGDKLAHRNSV